MAPEADQEAQLVARARDLIEQGLSLQQGAAIDAMEQWDEAVNELLEDVNRALTQADFSSRPLQRHLTMLIELYQQSLSAFAQTRDDLAAKAADLHQQRWEISG